MFKGPEVGKGRCERGKEKAGEVGLEKGAGPWSLLGARAGGARKGWRVGPAWGQRP